MMEGIQTTLMMIFFIILLIFFELATKPIEDACCTAKNPSCSGAKLELEQVAVGSVRSEAGSQLEQN